MKKNIGLYKRIAGLSLASVFLASCGLVGKGAALRNSDRPSDRCIVDTMNPAQGAGNGGGFESLL